VPVFYPTQPSTTVGAGEGVGDFDDLDQPICKMAQELHYDVLVLQHEIGTHDCVTEVIITKPEREILYVMEDIPTTMEHPQNIYPKIWFPQESGIVSVTNNVASENKIDRWGELAPLAPDRFPGVSATIEYDYSPTTNIPHVQKRASFGIALKQRLRPEVTTSAEEEEYVFEKFA